MKASDDVGQVVLGFDGGWRMQKLLQEAAGEAVRRETGLAIVMVSRAVLDPGLSASSRSSAEHRAETSAHRHLTRAAESVRARHPHLPVTTHHLTEEDARDATYPLASAQLLVVGTIGPHGRRAFSPESVSRILLRAARCPVLVVPHDVPIESRLRKHHTVTVGVGDQASEAGVLQAAGTEARRRECDLALFHAYQDQSDDTPALSLRRAADRVADALAAADVHLGAGGYVVFGHDRPVTALTRQARDTQLLVIGSRPGSLAGQVPGSVGLEIIGSLHCPLLVIPDPVPDPWSRSATRTATA